MKIEIIIPTVMTAIAIIAGWIEVVRKNHDLALLHFIFATLFNIIIMLTKGGVI